MTTVPTITLNDGARIPQLGFGTYQVAPDECRDAVLTALDAGYRHVDTAQMYGNEAQVGEALAAFDGDASQVYLTSKLNNSNHARDDALSSFDATLDALGVEQLDLFLVHWPLPGIDVDYVDTWRAMIEIARSGRCASVGVSNFQPEHLQRLLDETDVVPAVNQIEAHPYFHNDEVRAFGAEHGIVTEAWSPIAQGDVLDDVELTAIGEAHGKSSAQVALRWHIQRGDVIFPKSVTPSRVADNFAIFDFELSDEEMSRVDALDAGDRKGPHPDEMNRT